MRDSIRLSLVLVLTFGFLRARPVLAQPPDPSGVGTLLKTGLLGLGIEPGVVHKTTILQLEQVQKEIKVTAAQKERFKEAILEGDRVANRLNSEARIRSLELRTQDGEQAARAFLLQFLGTMTRLTTPGEGPLMKVLEPTQRGRLEQIQIQCEGPFAFTRPEIQERLNLSPEQVEAIGAIIGEGHEAINREASLPAGVIPRRLTPEARSTLMQSRAFQADLAKRRAAVKSSRRTVLQMISKLLTKGQRARYERLIGEPFDLTKTDPENIAEVPGKVENAAP